MAALPRLPDTGTVRLLDPGAGVGSLTASVIARAVREGLAITVHVTAFEVEDRLYRELVETLDDCRAVAARHGITVVADPHRGDFVRWATENLAGLLLATDRQRFDLVVMNPPYRKIGASSAERRLLARLGVEVPNLYAAFLALGAELLEPAGQLVAITPRSFTNGPYFRSFRWFFFDRVRLDRLHVIESRGTVFSDADVLQENVIIAATRSAHAAADTVIVSTSDGYRVPPRTRTMPYRNLIHPDDSQRFVRIAAYDGDTRVAAIMAALPATLADLDLEVSTGRVVDFRAREHLRDRPGDGTVPLIYPGHLRSGAVLWPMAGSRKPNALARSHQTEKLLLPAETYVLVNRFSAKEELRRVSAAVFDPQDVPCQAVGFENHLNVYHRHNRGLPSDLAHGLCLWLNSTVVDQYVRQFNGHTQVNATDLRSLRYPSLEELTALGAALGTGLWPEQDKIDRLVGEHVAALQERTVAEDSL